MIPLRYTKCYFS